MSKKVRRMRVKIPGGGGATLELRVELDQEVDGRWFAIIPALPGVMAYGPGCQEAINAAKTLATKVLADRLAHQDL